MIWFKRKTKQETAYISKNPLIWWIDDLTHEVCGLVDDPKRGLKSMPWPDCDEVYLAIDKTEYDRLEQRLKEAEDILKPFSGKDGYEKVNTYFEKYGRRV